jgi:hypothetical protein
MLVNNFSVYLRNHPSAKLGNNFSVMLRNYASAKLRKFLSVILWDLPSATLGNNFSVMLRNYASAVIWNGPSAALRDRGFKSLFGFGCAQPSFYIAYIIFTHILVLYEVL